jgi:hypothetical protein
MMGTDPLVQPYDPTHHYPQTVSVAYGFPAPDYMQQHPQSLMDATIPYNNSSSSSMMMGYGGGGGYGEVYGFPSMQPQQHMDLYGSSSKGGSPNHLHKQQQEPPHSTNYIPNNTNTNNNHSHHTVEEDVEEIKSMVAFIKQHSTEKVAFDPELHISLKEMKLKLSTLTSEKDALFET